MQHAVLFLTVLCLAVLAGCVLAQLDAKSMQYGITLDSRTGRDWVVKRFTALPCGTGTRLLFVSVDDEFDRPIPPTMESHVSLHIVGTDRGKTWPPIHVPIQRVALRNFGTYNTVVKMYDGVSYDLFVVGDGFSQTIRGIQTDQRECPRGYLAEFRHRLPDARDLQSVRYGVGEVKHMEYPDYVVKTVETLPCGPQDQELWVHIINGTHGSQLPRTVDGGPGLLVEALGRDPVTLPLDLPTPPKTLGRPASGMVRLFPPSVPFSVSVKGSRSQHVDGLQSQQRFCNHGFYVVFEKLEKDEDTHRTRVEFLRNREEGLV